MERMTTEELMKELERRLLTKELPVSLLYDERHEKYVKEQKQIKNDFEYLQEKFNKESFEVVTVKSSGDRGFVYSYHIKFNNKNVCSYSYEVKYNKLTITNDGIHWIPCDIKDLIEKINKNINNYLEYLEKMLEIDLNKVIEQKIAVEKAQQFLSTK